MPAAAQAAPCASGAIVSAGTTYTRNERAFPTLPRQHPKSIRRREVIRYKSYHDMNMKQEWDPSTQDALHPFPERAPTHTNSSYNGVDVVTTHFPDTVKGTSALRVPGGLQKPTVWTNNVSKSVSSHRHRYQCAALADPVPPLSYLAQKIVEDNATEKRRCEQQWCASTALVGSQGNRYAAPVKGPDYLAMNRQKLGLLNEHTYLTPYASAKAMNKELRDTRRLRREASHETPLTLHTRADAPAVFKMSNIDAWWSLDPVQVAVQQTELMETMTANPYMHYNTVPSDIHLRRDRDAVHESTLKVQSRGAAGMSSEGGDLEEE